MPKLITRYLAPYIKKDLKKKMVFLGGARQVGKTTLAQSLIHDYHDGHAAYLNWDSDFDRRKIRARKWPQSEKLIVLDEIHKFSGWRTFVKGLYDTLRNSHSFLITGSARLDHFRRGGDSLLGRYFYYRLHPFSLPELGINTANLSALMEFGGFPEPLTTKDVTMLNRWHLSRISRVVRDDVRDLEGVQELNKLELLAEELPRRVGSPLSIKSLAEDMEVDPKTAKNWVAILERLYYCFRIAPFGAPKIRAVKKEQKLYLTDWSQVEDRGARFENLVASQLLKFCHFQEDVLGIKSEVRFVRDRDGREVDFVLLQKGKPLFAVECKLSSQQLSPHIRYFEERTSIPKFYQVSLEGEERQISDEISIVPFQRFCRYTDMI